VESSASSNSKSTNQAGIAKAGNRILPWITGRNAIAIEKPRQLPALAASDILKGSPRPAIAASGQ
jgi:hypothetical protein